MGDATRSHDARLEEAPWSWLAFLGAMAAVPAGREGWSGVVEWLLAWGREVSCRLHLKEPAVTAVPLTGGQGERNIHTRHDTQHVHLRLIVDLDLSKLQFPWTTARTKARLSCRCWAAIFFCGDPF
jgi:hypothetical protein